MKNFKPPETNGNGNAWKLSMKDDDEYELIDDDDLLDEEDLKKPDPASLRGTGLLFFSFFSYNS